MGSKGWLMAKTIVIQNPITFHFFRSLSPYDVRSAFKKEGLSGISYY